jgi:hypothetical protein
MVGVYHNEYNIFGIIFRLYNTLVYVQKFSHRRYLQNFKKMTYIFVCGVLLSYRL